MEVNVLFFVVISWTNRCHSLNLDCLATVDCSAADISLNESFIQHAKARMELFVAGPIGKHSTLGHYYWPLVYEDLAHFLKKAKVMERKLLIWGKSHF